MKQLSSTLKEKEEIIIRLKEASTRTPAPSLAPASELKGEKEVKKEERKEEASGPFGPLPKSAEDLIVRLQEKEKDFFAASDRVRSLESQLEVPLPFLLSPLLIRFLQATSTTLAAADTHVEMLRQELLDKNAQLVVISDQLKLLREMAKGAMPTLSEDEEEVPPSISPPSARSSSDSLQVRAQFLRFKKAIQAHVQQNSFLSQQIQVSSSRDPLSDAHSHLLQQIRQETDGAVRAQGEALSRANAELATIRTAYQDLRRR